MPRSKEISLALRNQAAGLSRGGKSIREIATILDVHYNILYNPKV